MTEHKRHTIKKIGFYDSGLGGLFVMSHVQKAFALYDYTFLADEKNLPYGEKTHKELLEIARRCITFLIVEEKCDVVMIACNTLSATVYTTLEQEFKNTYPDVLLLDIITPTIDALPEAHEYVVFGTSRTIESHIYKNEIAKVYADSYVTEITTKDLASLIEKKESPKAYLTSFSELVPKNHATCILACTHYGLEREVFKKVFPFFDSIISQETIALNLFKFILHNNVIETQPQVVIYTTQKNPIFENYAKDWFEKSTVQVIDISI